MDPFLSGHVVLQQLADAHRDQAGLNEATTRFRIIDTVLNDVLRWPKGLIAAETYADGEYSDYELGHPSTELIVEAKREGLHFQLPPGIAGRRSVSVPTLLEDATTKQALLQVLQYCQRRGVPIGCITNGHQWVAFFASRQDGVAPLAGQALVFASLDEMVSDYGTFWQHLSRPGVALKNLQRTLLSASRMPQPPAKLSEHIERYPGFRSRTVLETDLKILAGSFIQDLEQESAVSEEFLRRCYCSSGALSQYALVSKEILRSRYTRVATEAGVEMQPARDKKGPATTLTGELVTASLSRRPLILLGDVGVGKSMFVRHLLRVEAADVLQDALIFYIDFGNEPALATDLERFVTSRMSDQLQSEHSINIDDNNFVRATYNSHLNKLKKGIFGALREADPRAYLLKEIEELAALTADRAAHIKKSLEHLRATRGRRSVVVLDNIDQRPQDFQDRVFLIAQSLSQTWPATVFVSLRPSTFYESRSRGSLAAYQLRVFTIAPTRTDDVIARRLAFARDQLTGAALEESFPDHLSLSGDDLVAYLDVLIEAFAHNNELKSLLDNISGGNLRLALTYLSSFVGSAYVSTKRILDVAASGETYTVPMHEFLRAIINGDFEYFDPSASDICNLFDVTANDPREHFLLPVILSFIQKTGESAGHDGYVNIASIYEHSQGLGFAQEQVGPHLLRAIDKRLIETPVAAQGDGPYRITSVGSYMVRSMLRRFVYIDAMVVDTPVTDVRIRGQLRDVAGIIDRLDRAAAFLTYLDTAWGNADFRASSSTFDWPVVSGDARRDIGAVRERAIRATQRRASSDL